MVGKETNASTVGGGNCATGGKRVWGGTKLSVCSVVSSTFLENFVDSGSVSNAAPARDKIYLKLLYNMVLKL